MEAKLALARWIVTPLARGRRRAAAEEHFTRVVREGGARGRAGRDVPATGTPCTCRPLLEEAFGLASTSEARRLIAQGGVRLDGEVVP